MVRWSCRAIKRCAAESREAIERAVLARKRVAEFRSQVREEVFHEIDPAVCFRFSERRIHGFAQPEQFSKEMVV